MSREWPRCLSRVSSPPELKMAESDAADVGATTESGAGG